MRCGVRGYLASPVFEPVWKHCIGVIELLTVMDGSYCLTDLIQKVSDSLMVCLSFAQPTYTHLSTFKGCPAVILSGLPTCFEFVEEAWLFNCKMVNVRVKSVS